MGVCLKRTRQAGFPEYTSYGQLRQGPARAGRGTRSSSGAGALLRVVMVTASSPGKQPRGGTGVAQPGFQHVSQRIAEEVEPQDRHENGQTGKDSCPGSLGDVSLRRRREHAPQLGTSGGTQTPRKLSDASMRIANPR